MIFNTIVAGSGGAETVNVKINSTGDYVSTIHGYCAGKYVNKHFDIRECGEFQLDRNSVVYIKAEGMPAPKPTHSNLNEILSYSESYGKMNTEHVVGYLVGDVEF